MATTRVAFDAYNARPVAPSKVAETFIPPDHFARLTRRAHSLVVGPRGSGKTTLMKMLTPEGLGAWTHPDAEMQRTRVTYTGIFIPTDITWTKQLEALSRTKLEPHQAALFVRASFTVAVLRAFAGSLAYRLSPRGAQNERFRALDVSPAIQSEVVRELADAWSVDLRIDSPLGLRASLGAQLSRIAMEANRERSLSSLGRDERLAGLDVLHLEMIPGLSDGLDRLEALVPEVQDERWALLFDELELAPSGIKHDLLSAMRSVDQRLLFKLSISPYSEELVELRHVLSSMPGHDHDEISLSYGRKEEGQDFSYDLMNAVLGQGAHSTSQAPTTRLGLSDFDDASRDPARYAQGSRVAKAFLRLSHADASFRQYLESHQISPYDLTSQEAEVRAQNIRKIMPLVIVREAYRSSDSIFKSTQRRLKSRKAPDIYRGASSIAAMLEGNPRWIISVMSALVEAVGPDSDGRIPVPLQVAEIARTANRFRALLTAIPSSFELGKKRRGLLPFIDQIGEFFKDRVLVDDFNPDPPGTFIVDASTPDAQIAAIGAAVNSGVVVYIPDDQSAPLLNSVRGKRFRLTYLFCPTYSLPLRLERAVSLSSIMRGDSRESVLFQLHEGEL